MDNLTPEKLDSLLDTLVRSSVAWGCMSAPRAEMEIAADSARIEIKQIFNALWASRPVATPADTGAV